MTKCTSIRKDTFEISKLDYSKYVDTDEDINISFSITNLNWLFPDKAFIYLYMNNQIVFEASPWINPNTTLSYNETFIINTPGVYKFHLSVTNNEMNQVRCEDYKNFSIRVLGEDESQPIPDWVWYLIVLIALLIPIWVILK